MKSKNLFWLFLSLAIILLDQWTKYLAVSHLTLNQALPIISGYFNFTLMHNPGASFSFLAEMSGWQRWFLSIISIIIIFALIKWLVSLSGNRYYLNIAISLIIGGAFGNLIDRLRLSYVIDFIQVYYKSYYYPAFNIADSSVVIGIFMILFYSLYLERKYGK